MMSPSYKKNMIFVLLGTASAVALCVLAIGLGVWLMPRAEKEPTMNALIERTLPPTAFQQQEYPAERVTEMMSACVNTERKHMRIPLEQIATFCGCSIDKRVHRLTLDQYMAAREARWDPKVVPQAVSTIRAIISECMAVVAPKQ